MTAALIAIPNCVGDAGELTDLHFQVVPVGNRFHHGFRTQVNAVIRLVDLDCQDFHALQGRFERREQIVRGFVGALSLFDHSGGRKQLRQHHHFSGWLHRTGQGEALAAPDQECVQAIRECHHFESRLEMCSAAIMYFDPRMKSPISLLEMGLFACDVGLNTKPSTAKSPGVSVTEPPCHNFRAPSKLHVVCPSGFWRKGNVDIVCQRYGILQYPTLKKATDNIKKLYDQRLILAV